MFSQQSFVSFIDRTALLISSRNILKAQQAWRDFFSEHLLQASTEEQLMMCNALLSQLPNAFAGYYYRGCAYMDLQDYGAALTDFLMANEKKPNEANVLYNIAVCQDQLNQTEQAIITCNQLLELEPNHISGLLMKATGLGVCKEYRMALQIFAQVEQMLHRAMDQQEALEASLKLYFNRSQVKRMMGDFDGAANDQQLFDQILSEVNI